jgi:protocatechuate 3,4-dioxygenase beta subunit
MSQRVFFAHGAWLLALLAALGMVAVQADDEAAVTRLISKLVADGDDEAARTALRRLISRKPPPSEELYGRVRDAFRAAARAASETLDPPDESGTMMHVEGRVVDSSGQPVPGALLYVFHADSTGWYARNGEMDERHPRLFAYLRTDREGRYSFRTARPGGYQKQYGGRYIPEHIHFEVSAAGRTPRRFQLVFRDDPRMDDYWLQWARTQDNPVADVVQRNGTRHCVVDITLK